MKAEDLTKMLNDYDMHVFTISEAAQLLKKSDKYVSLFLSKIHCIKRLERGKYYLDGTSMYEIASHIVSPSYLSLETAFKIKGLTAQIPIVTYVVSTKRHKGIKINGNTIKFVKFSKSRFFGYTYGNNVSIATVEKAIVDYLYLGYDYGYAAEIFGEALARDRLDIDRLKEFALMMQSRALVSKVGFLLGVYGVDASDLYKNKSRNYVRLSQTARAHDKRWRVIYEQQWLHMGKQMVVQHA